MLDPVRETRELVATFRRARFIAALRPDKYVRIAAAARREGPTENLGFRDRGTALPAAARLDRRAWRADLAPAGRAIPMPGRRVETLPGGTPEKIGIMCRNHRGFVEALVAAHRIGADVVLSNTSFAGPALAKWWRREGIDVVSMTRSGLRGRPRLGRQSRRQKGPRVDG